MPYVNHGNARVLGHQDDNIIYYSFEEVATVEGNQMPVMNITCYYHQAPPKQHKYPCHFSAWFTQVFADNGYKIPGLGALEHLSAETGLSTVQIHKWFTKCKVPNAY
jgi:hypothetical protein